MFAGGGAGEAPEAYKRPTERPAAHGRSIRVNHPLTPIGVEMRGADTPTLTSKTESEIGAVSARFEPYATNDGLSPALTPAMTRNSSVVTSFPT